MEEYEETMKAIHRMTETALKAQLASDLLKNKLIYANMHKTLTKIYRDLRVIYYDYENALPLAKTVNNCPDCGNLKKVKP